MVVLCSVIGAIKIHRRFDYTRPSIGYVASPRFLAIVGFLMIAWWMTIPTGNDSSFIDGIMGRLVRGILGLLALGSGGGSGGYGDSLAQYSALSNLLYNFGSDLLFTLAVLGILLIAHRSNQSARHLYLFAPAFVIFVLIYPMTQLGFEHVLFPYSILAFFQLFMVIFAGLALLHSLRQTSNPAGIVAVVAVVCILCFAMITTPYINRNSPVYLEDREPRPDLKDSEVAALVWVLEYNQETVVSRDPHLRGRNIMTLANIHDIEDRNVYEEYPTEEPPDEGTYIIRSYFTDLEEVPPTGMFGHNAERVKGADVTEQYREGDNVYDDNTVEIYQEGSANASEYEDDQQQA